MNYELYNKFYKGTDGKYYKPFQIETAIQIVYGDKYKIETAEDIEKLIEDCLLHGLVLGQCNPSVEELILSGSKVNAVKKYYDDFNNEHPSKRITIRQAKDIIDEMEKSLIRKDDTNE